MVVSGRVPTRHPGGMRQNGGIRGRWAWYLGGTSPWTDQRSEGFGGRSRDPGSEVGGVGFGESRRSVGECGWRVGSMIGAHPTA